MSEITPSPRRYTDAEVRALLERAAELHESRPPSSDATGLTLPELEAIAREAGLDGDAVRRAAAELDSEVGGTGRLPTKLAGAPVRVVLERTVPGEVPTESFETVIPLIRAASEAPGQASQVGRTLTWHAQSPNSGRELHVAITSRGGETWVRIEERYGALAGAVFGGGVGGIGGGVGLGVGVGVGTAIGSLLMVIGFPIAVIGTTYLGSRALFSSVVRNRRQTLDRLMSDLADALAAAADPRLPDTEA